MCEELKKKDPEIFDLVQREETRQRTGLEMIPSENYASRAVLEAAASIFNDKYAENYPGRRYYGGCENVDELERLCIKRAQEAFGAQEYYVNVQPYSGSPANLAVYAGLLEFGDRVMSLRLDHGGHLTHGSPVNFSGRAYKFVHYELDARTERLDYEEIAKRAEEYRPKILLAGYTAYPREIDFATISEIAKSVGAIAMVDMSHIAGLVAGKAHTSPFPFADVVTTTTHKTLRGPRGAMIFAKDEYRERIERAVFPGLQGGPHEQTIAGIAVALKEAMTPEFEKYAQQIVRNARQLAETLKIAGLKLVSDGTDNHLMLIDLRPFGAGRGVFVEKALEAAGISTNKSPVPNDPTPPYYPSGVRLGTPAITSRGMKEGEMERIGSWIAAIAKEFAKREMPEDKERRTETLREFVAELKENELVKQTRKEVAEFAEKFPVPGIE